MLEEREQRCLLNDLEIRVADLEQQRRVRDQVEQQKLIDELQEMVRRHRVIEIGSLLVSTNRHGKGIA